MVPKVMLYSPEGENGQSEGAIPWCICITLSCSVGLVLPWIVAWVILCFVSLRQSLKVFQVLTTVCFAVVVIWRSNLNCAFVSSGGFLLRRATVESGIRGLSNRIERISKISNQNLLIMGQNRQIWWCVPMSLQPRKQDSE